MKLPIRTGMIFLSVYFLSSVSFAQVNASAFSIKGTVIDSASQKPLDLVTAGLKTNGNQPVKTVLTSSKGLFSFEKVVPGKYKITLVSVGYQSKIIPVDVAEAGSKEINLGTIILSNQSNQLKEVSITADRPLVKQEVDRIAFDVQADPENKVNSVLDMLRKVPLVTLDAEDNIQVKGSGNFKVLINGRPSSLVARDPKEVFKSMPASNIQKIEVITTPPAKYDSEGLAGIINIVTNKKVDNGYNASLGIRQGFPNNSGGNASFTYKRGKFGAQGYTGTYLSRHPATTSGGQRLSFGEIERRLEQSGSSLGRGDFGYGNMELSYEIDSLNLITASLGLNRSANRNVTNHYSSQFVNGDVDQAYNLNSVGKYNYGGFDLGLNYQLGFKRNKEQLITASYKYTDSKNNQGSSVLTSNEVNFPVQDYKQDNKSGITEQTFQLDYVHPYSKINVEGGVKGILRNNFSNYHQLNFDPAEQKYITNPSRSNDFDYQQNVFGIYNSYQVKLKNWGLRAGLRLERTVVDANFASTSTTVNQGYNNFIPSVSVQRKLKNMASINLGYTQRIQRPGIWQLNPFVNQSDPRYLSTGNPELKAALNHSFELSYSKFKKGSVNMGLSYSFADNTVENVVYLRPDNVTVTTYQNIGQNKNLGVNMSVNYPFTPKFNVNVNGRLSYIWIKGVYNGHLLSNDGTQGNAFAYAGYRLDKGIRLGVNAGFFSPWIRLQGKSNNSYYTSFSASKEFLNKKATLSLAASNPWSKLRSWRNETSGLDFFETRYYNNFYRNVNLSFNYRFGKLQEQIKKNRRGINNDDVKGGGNSGGTGGGN